MLFILFFLAASETLTPFLQQIGLPVTTFFSVTINANAVPAFYYIQSTSSSYTFTLYKLDDSGTEISREVVDPTTNPYIYITDCKSSLNCKMNKIIPAGDYVYGAAGFTGCENGFQIFPGSNIHLNFRQGIPSNILPIYPNHNRCFLFSGIINSATITNNMDSINSVQYHVEQATSWTTVNQGQSVSVATKNGVQDNDLLFVKVSLGNFTTVPDLDIAFTAKEGNDNLEPSQYYQIPPPTPIETPYDTPYLSPFVTAFHTPNDTPFITAHTTPFKTVFDTPYLTPYSTNEYTPSITAFSTPFDTVSSTQATTPYITAFSTPHSTPYITNFNTPFDTPFSTAFSTAHSTPASTAHKTPFSTQFSTPFSTAFSTPYQTNGVTPHVSPPPRTNSETPFSTAESTPAITPVETEIPATPEETASTSVYIKTPRWTVKPTATPYFDGYEGTPIDPNPIIVAIKETHPPIQTDYIKPTVAKTKKIITVSMGTAMIVSIITLSVVNIIRQTFKIRQIMKGNADQALFSDPDNWESFTFSFYSYSEE
ncbi:hypothetical protein TVAG_476080 [Trichomonas vaginalis G3]|uniref:Uncharacterized protein n=1 Tax=Trichomonas vaginalis (strain ATCC PRA-98 / G3) TaxID=412133 RepID=A2DA31_TRIV3|nr:bifunctional inhibitor/lipid-transfer protein/seed storage 2s albumin superfamily protein family [Trichomonas vaginalis G3]EAY22679.1 hypothetical protein TVAG_476080 [Trichomonas vaginalis G3]KAI5525493.1 bifunctional inhibitor/lipid-transfer protein/seed storage 2s albumin superfamily protein family [Trichomonas vaginalis G3]|eukprot:XP_001583665.1 hypothetical protein [Trichomonas vaginalis G3]